MNRLTYTSSVCAIVASLSLLGPVSSVAHEFRAGIVVSEEVGARDTGLTVYPGAIPFREKSSDKSRSGSRETGNGEGANVDLSWGEYGLKVSAVKLRTSDSRERVAKFYEGDLARFGTVINCSDPANSEAESRSERRARVGNTEIRCKSVDAKRGAQVYRVGEKNNQRVVSLEADADGEGTVINLVHVAVRRPS